MHKFSSHLSILFVGIYSTLLFAQHDLKIEYSLMKITTAKVGGVTRTPTFYRHNAVLELGLGQATFGVVYQHAAKDKKTVPGKVENGVMLTAGYDLILSSTFRLEAFGRLGITSGNDPAQPLYATDTDLRLNLVTFTRDGVAVIRQKAVFPSLYSGLVINKYGRIQAIGGAGVWWNYFGFYVTGLHAFNGVKDPFNPGSDADITFANLQNSGVSFQLSYEFRDITFNLKRNHAIKNGGNDLTFSLQYHYPLGR